LGFAMLSSFVFPLPALLRGARVGEVASRCMKDWGVSQYVRLATLIMAAPCYLRTTVSISLCDNRQFDE
jgi:hypothetical protein